MVKDCTERKRARTEHRRKIGIAAAASGGGGGVDVCLFVIILHSAASGHGISRTHFLPASSIT